MGLEMMPTRGTVRTTPLAGPLAATACLLVAAGALGLGATRLGVTKGLQPAVQCDLEKLGMQKQESDKNKFSKGDVDDLKFTSQGASSGQDEANDDENAKEVFAGDSSADSYRLSSENCEKAHSGNNSKSIPADLKKTVAFQDVEAKPDPELTEGSSEASDDFSESDDESEKNEVEGHVEVPDEATDSVSAPGTKVTSTGATGQVGDESDDEPEKNEVEGHVEVPDEATDSVSAPGTKVTSTGATGQFNNESDSDSVTDDSEDGNKSEDEVTDSESTDDTENNSKAATVSFVGDDLENQATDQLYGEDNSQVELTDKGADREASPPEAHSRQRPCLANITLTSDKTHVSQDAAESENATKSQKFNIDSIEKADGDHKIVEVANEVEKNQPVFDSRHEQGDVEVEAKSVRPSLAEDMSTTSGSGSDNLESVDTGAMPDPPKRRTRSAKVLYSDNFEDESDKSSRPAASTPAKNSGVGSRYGSATSKVSDEVKPTTIDGESSSKLAPTSNSSLTDSSQSRTTPGVKPGQKSQPVDRKLGTSQISQAHQSEDSEKPKSTRGMKYNEAVSSNTQSTPVGKTSLQEESNSNQNRRRLKMRQRKNKCSDEAPGEETLDDVKEYKRGRTGIVPDQREKFAQFFEAVAKNEQTSQVQKLGSSVVIPGGRFVTTRNTLKIPQVFDNSQAIKNSSEDAPQPGQKSSFSSRFERDVGSKHPIKKVNEIARIFQTAEVDSSQSAMASTTSAKKIRPQKGQVE